MSKPLVDAIKEFLRIILVAIIPVIIGQLQNGTIGDWKVIATVAAIALLKAIDEFLHELGKEKESTSLTLGLTRF